MAETIKFICPACLEITETIGENKTCLSCFIVGLTIPYMGLNEFVKKLSEKELESLMVSVIDRSERVQEIARLYEAREVKA